MGRREDSCDGEEGGLVMGRREDSCDGLEEKEETKRDGGKREVLDQPGTCSARRPLAWSISSHRRLLSSSPGGSSEGLLRERKSASVSPDDSTRGLLEYSDPSDPGAQAKMSMLTRSTMPQKSFPWPKGSCTTRGVV